MKKPMSLSNVASELALSDFPSLPTPAVKKPMNNLLPGSVWNKKSHSVMQTSSGQPKISSSVTSGVSRKNKQQPLLDLWRQESVPEKWEDREDSSTLGSLSKMTLEDMVIVKDTSSKKKECKKTTNKQQRNVVKKLDDQLGAKRKMEEEINDDFVDPFPSLSSRTNQKSE
ncbi:unnamed protein product, partial [Brugia pahangi]|uniref:WH2 domain-containing protein n=1 Tax=Brugia pahangi TaxID=6280 RepID=A0A0N4TG69_BRUPA